MGNKKEEKPSKKIAFPLDFKIFQPSAGLKAVVAMSALRYPLIAADAATSGLPALRHLQSSDCSFDALQRAFFAKNGNRADKWR